MRLLFVLLIGLLTSVAANAQCGNLVMNPSTHKLDCIGTAGGKNLPNGYLGLDGNGNAVVSGAVTAGALIATGPGAITSNPSGVFQVSATNPMANIVAAGFTEIESNGTCENLSAENGSYTYSTASDTYCEAWTTAANVPSLTGTYNAGPFNGGISVVHSGATYYLLVTNQGSTGGAGAVYLLSSSALAGPWTVLNGGTPVFVASATPTASTYYIYNPTLQIVGSTWYFLIDGGNTSRITGLQVYSYATGCPSSCNFNTNLFSTPIFGVGSVGTTDSLGRQSATNSPQLIYVPDRNAFVALVSLQYSGNSTAYLAAFTTPSTSGAAALGTTSNWTSAPGMAVWFQNLTNVLSDPRLYFSPTVGLKGFNGVLSFYHNQNATWQAYTSLTLDQWYDAIVSPPTLPIAAFAQQNGTGIPVMSNNPYGPVQFNVSLPNSSLSTPYALKGQAFDTGVAGTIAGVSAATNFTGTANSTDTIFGLQALSYSGSTSTLAGMAAGYFQVNAQPTNPTTNGYAVLVDSPPTTGGLTGFTNIYGLYIKKQFGTNHYGIWQADAGDSNFFNGPTSTGSSIIANTYPSGSTSATALKGFVAGSNTSGTLTGVLGQVNWQGGSANNTGTIIGVSGIAVPNMGYTLSNAKAGYFQVQSQSTSDLVTNAYGVQVDSPTSAAGITNAYGVRIESQAGATNHYGIYQAGATDTNSFAGPVVANAGTTSTSYATATKCTSSASPAVCGSAAAGFVAIPTGITSVALTINTTAVTANSTISFFSDDTLSTPLGVTCNSTLATLVGGLAVTARTAGTSFTVTYNGTIATNPLCVSYQIVN
jgi:hypothetical protein